MILILFDSASVEVVRLCWWNDGSPEQNGGDSDAESIGWWSYRHSVTQEQIDWMPAVAWMPMPAHKRPQRGDNPPLHLKMEPSLGSDIGDCYDHAAQIVQKIGCVVNFDFNGVFCGVRPCDINPHLDGVRELFVKTYHRAASSQSISKICYANPI